jgi:hypothetical protein
MAKTKKFSDRIREQLKNKGNKKQNKNIEFSCSNCLNVFTFEYEDICMKKSGDLEFTPEPECPRCGATQEIVFSNYGQEKIEGMLFRNQIKTCK